MVNGLEAFSHSKFNFSFLFSLFCDVDGKLSLSRREKRRKEELAHLSKKKRGKSYWRSHTRVIRSAERIP